MHNRSLYQQILFNFIPVLGYWFLNWNMFSIVYIYWVEAVIIGLFVSLKVLIARGGNADIPEWSKYTRFVAAFKLLLFRWGIMLFYWIFILVFVALGQGKMDSQQVISNMSVLVMMDSGFNIAVMAFFLSQVIDFIQNFILNDEYKEKHPSAYRSLFDSRTIIIHVVIVLGTFAFQFLNEYAHFDRRLPGLGFVLLLFLVKGIADFFVGRTPKTATALFKQ